MKTSRQLHLTEISDHRKNSNTEILKNPASFRCALLIVGLQFKTTFSNHSEVAEVWGLLVSQRSFSNSMCSHFSFFTLHYHIAAIRYVYFLMLVCSHLCRWRQCTGYLGHVQWTFTNARSCWRSCTTAPSESCIWTCTRSWTCASATAISQLTQSHYKLMLLLLRCHTSPSLSPSLTQYHCACVIMQYTGTSPIKAKLLGKELL